MVYYRVLVDRLTVNFLYMEFPKPRVQDLDATRRSRATLYETGGLSVPLDGLRASRIDNDWARADLPGLARSSLAEASGRVGDAAVRDALDAVDAATRAQAGL